MEQNISSEQEVTLANLRQTVIDRYPDGEATEFTYFRQTEDGPIFATLTLDGAIAICGRQIAEEGPASVLKTLDEYAGFTEKLRNNQAALDAARAKGAAILARYTN